VFHSYIVRFRLSKRSVGTLGDIQTWQFYSYIYNTHAYNICIRSVINVIYYYYISSTTEQYNNNNMDALTINGGQCLRDENAAGRGVSVWIFA